MPDQLRSLTRRARDRVFKPYVTELGEQAADLKASIHVVRKELGDAREEARQARAEAARLAAELGADLDARARALDARAGALDAELALAREMLRHVFEQDAAQRRRLYALRASADYELAFSEDEPLVSFIIPTYDRFESLRDVSLPSILNQRYSNVEVIVAGDGAPPETERLVAELGDPRVRFHNRSVRGPYPGDESVRWYMLGTPPFNDGLALARGRWIAALGDDDAIRPEHTEVLLDAARTNRYEHCYGRHLVRYPNGETLEVGSFPPSKGEYVLQTSLFHAGLRFFEMEPADRLHAEPNDWSLCRRMLTAGVRFGMVEDLLADKFENRYHSHADWGTFGVPSVE